MSEEERKEIEVLKTRMEGVDKRFDTMDRNIEEMWLKIDLNREGQIKTQTVLEEIRKDITSMGLNIAKINYQMTKDSKKMFEKITDHNNHSNVKWEQFLLKSAWLLMGMVLSIIMLLIKNSLGL
ncbi:hypothetical protein [Chengkuizengella sediminis]|uniref:hypothetical protein n=1 Tax=Chengkuizengella sediminis TaxID=1885917 RepID=UPI0013899921|nr:hypothetical protein [Chengkuizengella sediminis]NDI35735.1 hypothetical protein [Chengkuizengella sediminis]